MLAVHPSVPAHSVGELVAAARANPGKLSYASAGRGTPAHLAGELFKLAFATDITHVPFSGGGPGVTAAVGGHVPITVSALPTALPHAKSGALRALALMSAKRSSLLPDVPTMAEATGQTLEADILTGLLAPAGTPKEIIDLLHREVAQHRRGAGIPGASGGARLRADREHARAVRRLDQDGNREVGESHPRREYRRAVAPNAVHAAVIPAKAGTHGAAERVAR